MRRQRSIKSAAPRTNRQSTKRDTQSLRRTLVLSIRWHNSLARLRSHFVAALSHRSVANFCSLSLKKFPKSKRKHKKQADSDERANHTADDATRVVIHHRA
jgi:hypothetical protein